MQIEYSKEATKHINQLDKPTKNRIRQAIEKLPAGDIRKLVGYRTDYRLRVGDYRVLFSRELDTSAKRNGIQAIIGGSP